MNDLLKVTDQMYREVSIPFPPKRIISLVPSQTEFLLDIGAPVAGRTKFCVHPQEKLESIPIVGGTKKFRFEKIAELNPDLIIGNKEENYIGGIEQLAVKYPVWMSDIYTLEDSFQMMGLLGKICDLEIKSSRIIEECKAALEKAKRRFSGRVVYLIWKNPWMAAGKNTFIDHLLTFLGYENVVLEARYPELSNEQIVHLNADKILLSSEPFPFKEKHINEMKGLCPDSEIELVDGELYSWYGSRLRNWK